jgi:hypothetical protein
MRKATFIVFVAVVVFIIATAGPPRAKPNPPGTFSFAVLGDAPYYGWEEIRYKQVRKALDKNDLSFIVHVGDIFWRPCSDAHYEQVFGWFMNMKHPVIYTPGDNEWTDCWQRAPGGYAPLERLQRIRSIFFSTPTRSLGRRTIVLASQGRTGPPSEFVENARWEHEHFMFATVHLVGSWNAKARFAKRTKADDDAAVRRTEAATSWMRETFGAAKATNALAVIIAFHADPGFESTSSPSYREAYEPFLSALEKESRDFAKPVLIMHGDDHHYVVDHPFKNAGNITRLEVPGSPRVGWVRVFVKPGAPQPFTFDSYVVPEWKYW